ncbi:hypothetical protein CCP4SC76_6710009 [Gammaproteobacteria bacterium]
MIFGDLEGIRVIMPYLTRSGQESGLETGPPRSPDLKSIFQGGISFKRPLGYPNGVKLL